MFLSSFCHQCHCTKVLVTPFLTCLLHPFASNFSVIFTLLIPLLSQQLRAEKSTSSVQDLALSFILDSSLPFRLKSPLLLLEREAQGLLLDIPSIVIFLVESKGGRSEAHRLSGRSRTWFPADAAEENWIAVKRSRFLWGIIHFILRQVFQVGGIHCAVSMLMSSH